jgi:hypothetical protein
MKATLPAVRGRARRHHVIPKHDAMVVASAYRRLVPVGPS